jgi:hypothetical protein
VAAAALIGAGLRFAALPAKSVWLDEAFSVWMAHHSPTDLWPWLVRIDHHPPLYYLLLHGWLGWFGDGPGAIRALSALCSTLAIPLIAGAARALGGWQVGLAAAWMLALAPWQVRYAQEARMYGLLVLAAAGVFYAAARILTHPTKTGRFDGRWLLLVASQAAAMLTHNTTTVLLPVALNVGAGGAWLLARRPPQDADLPGVAAAGFARRWCAAQVAALSLWAAVWLPGFWRQVQVVDARFWLQPPVWMNLAEYGQMLAAGFLPVGSLLGWTALVLVMGLAGAGGYAWRGAPGKLWLAVALWLVPPLVELAASVRRPLFHLSSLVWTALPFCLLAAVGWTYLARRRVFGIGYAALLLLLWGLGLRGYFVDFQKERWDLAAAHVLAAAEPGDLVLFNATWVQLPFAYYARTAALPLDLHGAPVDLFARGELEPVMTADDLPALAARVQGRDRVWLVYAHNWYTDPEGLIPAELDRRFAKVDTLRLPEIEIRRYSVPRSAP